MSLFERFLFRCLLSQVPHDSMSDWYIEPCRSRYYRNFKLLFNKTLIMITIKIQDEGNNYKILAP